MKRQLDEKLALLIRQRAVAILMLQNGDASLLSIDIDEVTSNMVLFHVKNLGLKDLTRGGLIQYLISMQTVAFFSEYLQKLLTSEDEVDKKILDDRWESIRKCTEKNYITAHEHIKNMDDDAVKGFGEVFPSMKEHIDKLARISREGCGQLEFSTVSADAIMALDRDLAYMDWNEKIEEILAELRGRYKFIPDKIVFWRFYWFYKKQDIRRFFGKIFRRGDLK